MPWCETCAKFWTPSSMTPDGACPSCGRTLSTTPVAGTTVAPDVAGATPGDDTQPPGPPLTLKDLRQMAVGPEGDGDDVRAPWHFKLMLAALALYLGYRAVQLVILIVR